MLLTKRKEESILPFRKSAVEEGGEPCENGTVKSMFYTSASLSVTKAT